MKNLITCTPKHLPSEQLVEAARTAVRINAYNQPRLGHLARAVPGFQPTPMRIAVVTQKYWGPQGVRLTVGFGPFGVPCEVVYTLEEPRRSGFGYGTLRGHQESGEGAFLVERDEQDRVWFRVISFSRAVRWPAMLGGPLTMLVQRGYARLLGRTLKRLCTPSRTVGS